MIRVTALALLALTASACGRDVVLGHHALSSDATPPPDDAPAETFDARAPGADARTASLFWPGLYHLTYGPDHDTMCDGSVVGTEAAYASITAPSVDLIDGDVELVLLGRSTIRLDGASLEPAFATRALVLQAGVEEAPEQFVAQRARDGSAGPPGTTTQLTAVALGLDETTASGRGADGFAALAYETPDRTSACVVGFPVTVTAIGF